MNLTLKMHFVFFEFSLLNIYGIKFDVFDFSSSADSFDLMYIFIVFSLVFCLP